MALHIALHHGGGAVHQCKGLLHGQGVTPLLPATLVIVTFTVLLFLALLRLHRLLFFEKLRLELRLGLILLRLRLFSLLLLVLFRLLLFLLCFADLLRARLTRLRIHRRRVVSLLNRPVLPLLGRPVVLQLFGRLVDLAVRVAELVEHEERVNEGEAIVGHEIVDHQADLEICNADRAVAANVARAEEPYGARLKDDDVDLVQGVFELLEVELVVLDLAELLPRLLRVTRVKVLVLHVVANLGLGPDLARTCLHAFDLVGIRRHAERDLGLIDAGCLEQEAHEAKHGRLLC
mmetsp:Transcript_7242/g.18422  ORF Transcript_7242/g.18422 Transcript_7242/m.18422 type:complete len:291 (+) Transcript_7242:3106-3978(+)